MNRFLLALAIVGLALAVPVPHANEDYDPAECVEEEVEVEPAFVDDIVHMKFEEEFEEEDAPCEASPTPKLKVATPEPTQAATVPVTDAADCVEEDVTEELKREPEPTDAPTVPPTDEPAGCDDEPTQAPTAAPTVPLKREEEDGDCAGGEEMDDMNYEGEDADYYSDRGDSSDYNNILDNAEAAKMQLEPKRIDFSGM